MSDDKSKIANKTVGDANKDLFGQEPGATKQCLLNHSIEVLLVHKEPARVHGEDSGWTTATSTTRSKGGGYEGLAGETYEMVLTDGTQLKGKLTSAGSTTQHITMRAGTCDIRFPDFYAMKK